MTLCPIIHQQYTAGTYSVAVFALTSTSFNVEVLVSKNVCTDMADRIFVISYFLSLPCQAYPLPPPRQFISCDDVPQSAFEAAALPQDPVFCMEDGVELVVTQEDANPECATRHGSAMSHPLSQDESAGDNPAHRPRVSHGVIHLEHRIRLFRR